MNALAWFLLVITTAGVLAQEQESLPFPNLSLQDLSAFRSPGPNWKIVGNVFADTKTDQLLEASPGKGILANLSDEKKRAHLFTRFEHGDLEIEMDVLMAKNSNSGIYLQGRYEVQLFDSWGKKDTKYGYMGGIYQRTDTVTNQGYEGSAPRVNACKAPGLWQKLRIVFQAPVFDASGKKISDARFLKVYLNGMLVQDDVSVSGPTRSAAFEDEQPLGPLMIQGNHGRVAFRNIRYKLYDGKKVGIRDVVYREYKTPGEFLKSTANLEKTAERKVDSISRHLAAKPDIFLMEYRGLMEFPKSGRYLFTLQTGGGGVLIIRGDTLIRHDGANGFDQKVRAGYTARAGSVPFALIYNKPIQYREGLALFAEGPGMATHPLHATGSVFHEPRVEPLLIAVDSQKAVIQRTFMDSGKGKKTHCLSVATPEGVHFTIDLQSGNLFQVWDGGFLDATPMWHRRGNQQVAIPLGPRILFSDGPRIGIPGRPGAEMKFVEYVLDPKGLPDFRFVVESMTISEKFLPASPQRAITHKIQIEGPGDFDYTLATGDIIEQQSDGSFIVNDKEYYLIINTPGLKPVIRKAGTSKAIVLTATSAGSYEFEYTMLW